jgi:hypothetical protein
MMLASIAEREQSRTVYGAKIRNFPQIPSKKKQRKVNTVNFSLFLSF